MNKRKEEYEELYEMKKEQDKNNKQLYE